MQIKLKTLFTAMLTGTMLLANQSCSLFGQQEPGVSSKTPAAFENRQSTYTIKWKSRRLEENLIAAASFGEKKTSLALFTPTGMKQQSIVVSGDEVLTEKTVLDSGNIDALSLLRDLQICLFPELYKQSLSGKWSLETDNKMTTTLTHKNRPFLTVKKTGADKQTDCHIDNKKHHYSLLISELLTETF